MGLASFLREAIDCYEKNPEAAWLGLEHAEAQAQLEEQEDAVVPRFGPHDKNKARTLSRATPE